jgi:hypothetical protein
VPSLRTRKGAEEERLLRNEPSQSRSITCTSQRLRKPPTPSLSLYLCQSRPVSLSLSLSARLQPKNHFHNRTLTTPSLSSPSPMYPQQSHPAPSSRPYTFPAHQTSRRKATGANSLASNFHRVLKVTCSPSTLESRKAGVARAKKQTNI